MAEPRAVGEDHARLTLDTELTYQRAATTMISTLY
jgi:hypothetical protein